MLNSTNYHQCDNSREAKLNSALQESLISLICVLKSTRDKLYILYNCVRGINNYCILKLK